MGEMLWTRRSTLVEELSHDIRNGRRKLAVGLFLMAAASTAAIVSPWTLLFLPMIAVGLVGPACRKLGELESVRDSMARQR